MTKGNHSREPEIVVYLGLGSNIGDREANLKEAIKRIENLGLEVRLRSSIYETEPIGFTDQPWFLNQVIQAELDAELVSEGDHVTIAVNQAEALLSGLLDIEREMGRERTIANGPRVIDIDLLLFGELIIASSKQGEGTLFNGGIDVFVPHPRMHLRRFVLEPLCEIAPEQVHPVLKKTFREILESLDDRSVVSLCKAIGD